MPGPGLPAVLREWGRIGCIGFGGPPAHIALLRELCVERRGWLERARVRGRDRRLQPAARARPRPSSRSSAPGACAAALGALVGGLCFIVPGLVADPGAGGALPRRLAAGLGARRRRGRGRGGRGGRRAAPGWRPGPGRAGRAARGRSAALGRLRCSPGVAAAARSGRGWSLVLLACGAVEVARAGAAAARLAVAAWPLAARGRRDAAGCSPLAWVGAQGRRALLRRRLRDHPADAGRRGRPLPLDDRRRSSSTPSRSARSRPGPVVHTVAVVGYAAAGLGGGLLAAAVAFAPSFAFVLLGARPLRPPARATHARARVPRRRRPGGDRRDPRLGDPARAGARTSAWQYGGARAARRCCCSSLRRGVVLTLPCAAVAGVLEAVL